MNNEIDGGFDSSATLKNTLISDGNCNYLEEPTIAAYFLTRELLACYSSIKHVEDKRDYYSTLIPALVGFLDLIEKYGDKILSSTVFNKIEITAENKVISRSAIKDFDPEGYELLGLADPLNFSDLKYCYRRAATKHHPDKGGATREMQIVNRAYKIYSNYLCGELLVDVSGDLSNNSGDSESVNNYTYLVNATLLQIYCDDWDLDRALRIVDVFIRTNFQGVTVKKSRVDHFSLVETALALTKKLTAAKRISDAGIALDFTHAIYDIGKFHMNPYHEKALNQVNSIVAGEAIYRFKINHIRQAENALALGVISQRKFEELKMGLNVDVIDEELIGRNLEGILSSGFRFSVLPFDNGIQTTGVVAKNTPGMNYFDNLRVHLIPINNQIEYFKTFFEAPTVELIRKYTYVRLVSYIMSLDDGPSKEFISNIISECKVFNLVHDSRKVKFKTTRLLIGGVIGDLEFLRDCNDSGRVGALNAIKSKYIFITKRQDACESIV